MATSTNPKIDLVQLFGTVAQTLNQNKSAMNEADTYNHDHGDNMVQIFDVITQAMKAKSGTSPADQLGYASQLLKKQSSSGSAQIYSEGLSDAAKQFAGQKSLTAENITQLVTALLGASPSPSANQGTTPEGDLIGSLLGALTGNATDQTPSVNPTGQVNTNAGGDLIGSLLESLTGTDTGQKTPSTTQNNPGSIDLGDIVNAGLTFFQTKQSGGSNMTALINALTASSKVGSQDYRAQSGALVATTLINAVTKMAQAKK
ncbi:MAG: DAK2 domain-containing protein [Anaerolineaceae bacterium]